MESGLPQKILADGTVSQVKIVPFYDRSELIQETLGTLSTALLEEILVTIIVVLLMLFHLRSSILIAGLLPLAVLMCFIAMRTFGVDANIVALSGIAIAIGTMVDMGVVIIENILRHLDRAKEGEASGTVILRATREVGGAILTAVLTTVVSFLPVFTMEAAEGKLFRPLAFTKTFALLAAIVVALAIIPPLAHLLFTPNKYVQRLRVVLGAALGVFGCLVVVYVSGLIGAVFIGTGAYWVLQNRLPKFVHRYGAYLLSGVVAFLVAIYLAREWSPLGPEYEVKNMIFVVGLIGGLLSLVMIFYWLYVPMLRMVLRHKATFLVFPTGLVLVGVMVWMGFAQLFGVVPRALDAVGINSSAITQSTLWSKAEHTFPGLGKEFMPPLDEGSYLYMPTAMPHASIGMSMDMMRKQDIAIRSIPEVKSVVGKLGRADTPLDPAPVAMVETVVNYVAEYKADAQGHRLRFKYDDDAKEYVRDAAGNLIEDEEGRLFRQWRDHIRTPDDIWDEIVRLAQVPGSTSAPKLQPIAARLVMLQSGMRAPMGVKLYGPDQESIEAAGLIIEQLLKEVPQVNADAVIADRVVGKPYLEIDIDREAIARYGLTIRAVQDVIEVAVGGRHITTTVEGRERYTVRVRYMRELRDQIESLDRILVSAPDGTHIPLGQLSTVNYRRGPQAIKSENTSLVSYVLFDKRAGFGEIDTVEAAKLYIDEQISSGAVDFPTGVRKEFAGNYENHERSQKRLRIVLPFALFLIFMILYLLFKRISTSLLVFSGILVAWAGGFQMIWLYGQPWFLDITIFDTNMRDLFQVQPINLSVATWVGFLALFGIASDDGVIMATYLKQRFEEDAPDTIEAIRESTIEAARRRIRPCLMTSATTILALIPILTSTGRGSDIMLPMAIPSFGGMTVVILTVFVVPVLYCMIEEVKWKVQTNNKDD